MTTPNNRREETPAINDVITDVDSSVADVSRIAPPPSYESACAAGAGQQLNINTTQLGRNEDVVTSEDKPPSYLDALIDSVELPENNQLLSVNRYDSSQQQSIPQYPSQNDSSLSTHQYPQSLTNNYPPATVYTPTNFPTLTGVLRHSQRQQRVVTQVPVGQQDMDRDSTADLQTSICIYFTVSCFTCLFCNIMFGGIGMCFAYAAKQAADRGDVTTARVLGRRAMICCVIGILITLVVVFMSTVR